MTGLQMTGLQMTGSATTDPPASTSATPAGTFPSPA